MKIIDIEEFYEDLWFDEMNEGIKINRYTKPNGEWMHDIIPGASPVMSVFPKYSYSHYVEIYL